MAERFELACYESLDQLLEYCPDTEMAVVATPTLDHVDTASRLLENGVACLVEKPIAHSVQCAIQLAKLSKITGTLLAVGHIERYNPAVIRLRELLLQGALGEVKVLNARRAGPAPDASRGSVADILVDIGIHEIDICRFLLDRNPRQVRALGGTTSSVWPVMDYASLLLDFEGICSQIQVDWLTPHKTRRLEIMGTSAMASLEYITQDLTISYRSEAPLQADDFPQILLASAKRTRTEQVDVASREPLFLELSAFLSALNGDGTDIVTADDAIESLRIALAATDEINSVVSESR